MKKASSSRAGASRGSKVYKKPTVKAYGNIHQITAGKGNQGHKDSQSPVTPNKTLP